MSSDTCSRSSGSPCSSPTPTPVKPTNKRCNKPQMERKRRERINVSLNVLKQLVLDALKKDTSQYSKLEKADILEMTVKHLRDLQRRQLLTAANNDVTVVGKYRAGFTECATEVSRYLSSVDGLRPDVRDRLMGHLSGCVHRVSSPPAAMHDVHIQQPQRHVAMTSPHITMTSPQQQMMTSQLMTSQAATRPIQIQIPMATSPGSLPGAGIQALQLAASAHSDTGSMTSSRASSCSPPQHNTSYSPVTSPQAYIGAFQVIPNGQIPAYLLQQNGRQQEVNISASGTPLYVSTSSLQQVAAHIQQQLPHSVLPSSGVAMKRQAPEIITEAPPMKKMMSHCYGVQHAAKLAINETLSDEKVWRPW